MPLIFSRTSLTCAIMTVVWFRSVKHATISYQTAPKWSSMKVLDWVHGRLSPYTTTGHRNQSPLYLRHLLESEEVNFGTPFRKTSRLHHHWRLWKQGSDTTWQKSQIGRPLFHTPSSTTIPCSSGQEDVGPSKWQEPGNWQEERRQLLLSTTHYGGMLCSISRTSLNWIEDKYESYYQTLRQVFFDKIKSIQHVWIPLG